MKTILLMTALALGGATAANAAPDAAGTVPACSKSVTDNCIESTHAARPATHHKHARHAAAKSASVAPNRTPARG